MLPSRQIFSAFHIILQKLRAWLLLGRWGRLLRIVASGLMLLWLACQIDQHTWVVLSRIPFLAFATCLLVFAMAQFFGSWRLYLLLDHPTKISFLDLLHLTFASYFFANFLPSTIGGDIYKGVKLIGNGMNNIRVISCLLADRFTNFVSVFFISLIVVSVSTLSKSY